MIRPFLFLIGTLVLVLARILASTWLYVLAALILLAAVGLYGQALYSKYLAGHTDDETNPGASSSTTPPQPPSLEELGIVSIQPKTSEEESEDNEEDTLEGKPPPGTATSFDPTETPSQSSEKDNGTQTQQNTTGSSPVSSARPRTTARPQRSTKTSAKGHHEFIADRPLGINIADLVQPYLTVLHRSIKAHSVCLLQLDPTSEECSVEAAISRSSEIKDGGTIPLTEHPINQIPWDEPVTILVAEGGEPSLSDLGYYTSPIHIDKLATAPVRTPDGVIGVLIADRRPEEDTMRVSHYRLLAEFAKLFSMIIQVRQEDRPRAEIIDEEIRQASRNGSPLALALVHPNDADTITHQGPGEIARAEYTLHRLLEEVTPEGRVERFGELVYGVFCYQPSTEVDEWAKAVQDIFAEANQQVSIGVAIYSDRHESSQDLRSDATEALRVAYESGNSECVIFE